MLTLNIVSATTTTTAAVTTTTAAVTTTTAAVTTTTAAVTTTTSSVTTTTSSVTTTTLQPCGSGDVNDSKCVSIFDALLVAKHDVQLVTTGPPPTPLTGDALARANKDCDSDVDIWDALAIAVDALDNGCTSTNQK